MIAIQKTTKPFITGREVGKKSLELYHHADFEETYILEKSFWP
jgi:hypothetical protein